MNTPQENRIKMIVDRARSYNNDFTYEGKQALFDYLEQLEADTGEDIELDIVALCCEYSEFEDATEAASEYSEFISILSDEFGNEGQTRKDANKRALKFLQNRTQVIEMDNGGIIIQQF